MRRILLLTLLILLTLLKTYGQCDYTNTMPATVGSNKTVCFTSDVTITHASIQNQGTITINDGVTVTFNGSITNYWATVGKFKLMSCNAKIDISGSISGSWNNVDIDRYCGGGSCSDVTVNGSGVDLGYFKSSGSVANLDVKCQAPLPVELISYTCNKKEILWSTGSEINSDYFTVLYSDNGIDFVSLNIVAAQGNSTEVVNYSYPITKKGYYRLTQTDYDGTTENFNVKFCGPDNDKVKLIARYDLLGQIIQDSYRGIVIEVYSDGSTKRIYKNN